MTGGPLFCPAEDGAWYLAGELSPYLKTYKGARVSIPSLEESIPSKSILGFKDYKFVLC
jgi:hypothetical protein